MTTAKNWTCPFCNRPQVVVDDQQCSQIVGFDLKQHCYEKPVGLRTWAIACSSTDCSQISYGVDFGYIQYLPGIAPSLISRKLAHFTLSPPHLAKTQPAYIPQAIRADYLEACKIRDLSPKASATLARRCLQGMIRDFCGISKARLVDEIDELQNRLDNGTAPKGVSAESIEGIHHVRKIGNIGAHMEKHIDVIIDVDPDEAQVLIELIEMLLEDWYVERQKRQERFKSLAEIAEAKNALKNGQPAAQAPNLNEK